MGAGLYKLLQSYDSIAFDITLMVGFIVSFISGVLVIKYFLKFLKNNDLYPFILYRLIIIILVLVVLI